MFEEKMIQQAHFSLSQPYTVYDKSSIEPDICLTSTRGWVIWTQQHFDGDKICARAFSYDGVWHAVIEWSTQTGVECQPALVSLSDEHLLGVHVAHRDGLYHLIVRHQVSGKLSEETSLYSREEGLFRPRLLVQGESVWLVFEATEGNATRLMMMRYDGTQWQSAQTIATPSAWCSRVALAQGKEGAIWCAYDAYQEGCYDVYLQRLDTPSSPLRVTDGAYQSLQPALMGDADGRLWIAYATNANKARRDRWWLTKWNEIRCFGGDAFHDVPVQPQRDPYNEDSFQGWEFPAMAQMPSGEVWLFGQSAHTLFMASCDQEGWSDLHTIADKHWGSWKPRIRVAGNEPFYLVSMGLQGAQIQRLDVSQARHAPPLLRHYRPINSQVVSQAPSKRQQITSADEQTLNYYFGDLHAHSIYGDATNDVDEIYHRYRDAYHYDFACLTEHDYLDGIMLSKSELTMLWDVAKRMSESEKFIAMYGYEWTSPAIAEHATPGSSVGEGHRHVIYPDATGELVSYGQADANTGAKLLKRLQGRRALVIPHHTSWSGTDWDAHDPELQRVVEICSTHGRFEYSGNLPIGYRRDHIHPNKFVLDALARGYRLGFVGGSDSHGLRWHATEPEGRDSFVPAGTRVGWKEDAYRTGMTVVLAPELTRQAIFDALYQRRCYATTGEPIILDFRINQHLMGTEIHLTDAPLITVDVKGTQGLKAVEVIRSGHIFGGVQIQPGERITSLSFELTDQRIIPHEQHYYYLRVLQDDGNMAWSSPIWVTYSG